VTGDPIVTGLGLAVTDACVAAFEMLTVVDPVEADVPLPEYVPKTRSVPTGAADELHEPMPPDSVAVHSAVDPVEKVTDPLGVPGDAVAE
jgi:hypothetical protein